jgi:uncharacterized delta-60 repeat protein
MRLRLIVGATVLVTLAAAACPANAAPGDLDPTFSGDGRQLTDFAGNEDNAGGVAVQPDGKIVAAGTSRQGADANFAVARYNANGTLDGSFSGDGRQTTNFGGGDIASAVALQPDGKIVVGGFSQQGPSSRLLFALARYNADGTPDFSFAGTGMLTTDFGGIGDASVAGVAVQPDGKIVAAGTSSGPGGANVDFAIARYTTNGTPDNSFSGDGRETIDFDGRSDNAAALNLQVDGKILIAGSSADPGGDTDFALLRFNPTGTLDSSFSGDGRQLTDFGGARDTVGGMALQAGGKIVLSGSSDTTPSFGFAVARYNANGTLDGSFSGDGRQTADFGGGGGPAVAVQPDGSIVVAGRSDPGNFALARFIASGPLDASFSGDGKQATDFGGRDDEALAVALQSDGKIVAAGYSAANLTGAGGDIALARYAGGTLPPAYPRPSKPSFPFAGCPVSTSNVILGTSGNDIRNGTPGADRIFTRAGNDRSDGRGGNDCIDLGGGNDRGGGGRGNDLLLGGSGRDRLSGSSGGDRLSGGSASDRIAGSSGNDRLNGGSGSDRIAGSSGSDRLNGGSGSDRLNGGSGRDRISGSSGNDRISARDGRRDRVNCGRGRDRVRADRIDRVARNCERVRRS